MDRDENECVICYNSYTTGIITECGHRCCLKCGLRYKFISNKSGCPICLREVPNDEMMFRVVKSQNEVFRATNNSYTWANCIICKPDEIQEIEELLARICKLCKTEFYDNKTLMAHYVAKHKRYLCELCVECRCEFPFEYIVYSLPELNAHRTEKTIGNGHPMCGFCGKRFYTPEILVKHCRKTHELCYLCERLGKKNEYYKNYNELENHLKKVHYTCTEKMCLEAKCYAFIDEVELAAHMASLHSFKKEQKIKLQRSLALDKKKKEERKKSTDAEPIKQAQNPVVVKHLDREELLRNRNMKDKYSILIRRSYQDPDEVINITEMYDKLEIDLEKYVSRLREILGDIKAIEFIDRIITYLTPDRMKDIKVHFPRIKRLIEFAPCKMLKKRLEDIEKASKGHPAAHLSPVETLQESAKTVEKAHTKSPTATSVKTPFGAKLGWSSALDKIPWKNKPELASTLKPIHISKLEIKLPEARKTNLSKVKDTKPNLTN